MVCGIAWILPYTVLKLIKSISKNTYWWYLLDMMNVALLLFSIWGSEHNCTVI